MSFFLFDPRPPRFSGQRSGQIQNNTQKWHYTIYANTIFTRKIFRVYSLKFLSPNQKPFRLITVKYFSSEKISLSEGQKSPSPPRNYVKSEASSQFRVFVL